MSTPPLERRVLLGNFDRFADGIHYDLEGGQIERLPEGRIVGVPRHGWFVERDGTFMALLRDEVSLWFVTGGERHDVQQAEVARNVDGDDHELTFSRSGTVIAAARYHDPQPARNRRLIAPKLDYTAMAEPEHFDWSLFIFNVFGEPGRRDRIGARVRR